MAPTRHTAQFADHRRYILRLVELVQMGAIDPAEILSQREPLYRSWTRIARSTNGSRVG